MTFSSRFPLWLFILVESTLASPLPYQTTWRQYQTQSTFQQPPTELKPDKTVFVYFFHKQIPPLQSIISKQIAFVN